MCEVIALNFHILVYMESILIHPENMAQLKAVKAVLKVLKVPFEFRPGGLPPHVLKSIDEGIRQYENGEGISFEEFADRHFIKT